MGFLKKLGLDLVQFGRIFAGFAPLAQAVAPQYAPAIAKANLDLSAIGDLVVQVEAMGAQQGLTGAQKLQIASGLAAPIVAASNLLSGRKLADPKVIGDLSTQTVQLVVNILNAVHEDSASGASVSVIKS